MPKKRPKERAAPPPPELAAAILAYQSLGLGAAGLDASFSGGKEDLVALHHCEYEVFFPDQDLRQAALIWAQVMVNSGGAIWLSPVHGHVAISLPSDGWPAMVFIPHPRLLELKGLVQCDAFELLTRAFLHHAISAGHKVEEVERILALCGVIDCEIDAFRAVETTSRLLRIALARKQREVELRGNNEGYSVTG